MSTVAIDCPCVGTPHPDGDVVTLRDTLAFRSVLAIRWAFHLAIQAAKERGDSGLEPGEWLALLSEQYVYHGVESWTLVDERGEALPVTHSSIEALTVRRPDVVVPITDAADTLYTAVMLPLIQVASPSSPPTPTEDSTSPTTPSSTETKPTTRSRSSNSPPTPSSPSSTTTTPTGDTEPTSLSLVGASS